QCPPSEGNAAQLESNIRDALSQTAEDIKTHIDVSNNRSHTSSYADALKHRPSSGAIEKTVPKHVALEVIVRGHSLNPDVKNRTPKDTIKAINQYLSRESRSERAPPPQQRHCGPSYLRHRTRQTS